MHFPIAFDAHHVTALLSIFALFLLDFYDQHENEIIPSRLF